MCVCVCVCVCTGLGEKMSDEEAEAMIKQADLDGDGRICWDEFLKMMLNPNVI